MLWFSFVYIPLEFLDQRKVEPCFIKDEHVPTVSTSPLLYRQDQPTPLVFVLHGYSGTAQGIESSTGFSGISDREGFIAVYPNALPWTTGLQMWCGGGAYYDWWDGQVDDVNFFETLIDVISTDYTIDPNRIYAFGHSNGGFMCHHLGARLPHRFAAIAPCAGLMALNDFVEGPPVSVIHFHGEDDAVVAYGGIPHDGFMGVESIMQAWAQRNGCDSNAVVIRNDTMTLARKWSTPDISGDVILYKLKNYGHGLSTRSGLNSPEIAWEFFKSHPRMDMNECLQEDGPVVNVTQNLRYSSFDWAMYFAEEGDHLVLSPGFYPPFSLIDKQLVITSEDPNDPYYIGGTIFQGDPNEPVITLSHNSEACILAGLTIRAGAVGIAGTATQATLRNCRLMDNLSHGLELSDSSNPYLNHCLITANGQSGIIMHDQLGPRGPIYCEPIIEDCVIVQNGEADIVGGDPNIIHSIVSE